MLKAVLVAIAAFTAVDAAVWGGQYRVQVIRAALVTTETITSQDWDSGPPK